MKKSTKGHAPWSWGHVVEPVAEIGNAGQCAHTGRGGSGRCTRDASYRLRYQYWAKAEGGTIARGCRPLCDEHMTRWLKTTPAKR